MGFWGANGHDGIWHIALTESLSKGDFSMPVFAGYAIQNYHIGFDLILAGLHKLTSIPIVNLYFQILPVVLSISVGFLVYKFVETWQKSKKAAFWATFFVYFGGSWGFLVSLLRGNGWGGESMFWSQQSISTLINPPFALSLVIILLGLTNLQKYLTNKSKLNFILAVLFFGASIFIKVYAGLLVLTALLVCGLYALVINHQSSILKIFLLSLILSMLLFIPFNKSSVGLVTFAPFWFLESMMAFADRFNWQRMYSAMTTYRMGEIWFKAIPAYGLVFTIFILGNFGTRIIALKMLPLKFKKIFSSSAVSVFLFTVITAGIIAPMFFVQKGTPWNTIQFFYYSLFFTGIWAGIAATQLIEKIKRRYNAWSAFIFSAVIILLTIPTTLSSLGNYLSAKPQSILPKEEMEALEFLSKQPVGTVLTYPFDKVKANLAESPKPLSRYVSTAYVSAFSGQNVYLEDEMNLDIMQYPWKERRESQESFLNTSDVDSASKYLRDNRINYIYWLNGEHTKVGTEHLMVTEIFQNNSVTIFKVVY